MGFQLEADVVVPKAVSKGWRGARPSLGPLDLAVPPVTRGTVVLQFIAQHLRVSPAKGLLQPGWMRMTGHTAPCLPPNGHPFTDTGHRGKATALSIVVVKTEFP